jgi:hypothetical protein
MALAFSSAATKENKMRTRHSLVTLTVALLAGPALAADFNYDGRADIAFHRPGSTWNTVPVLLSNGNGSFAARNYGAPSWANQPGVVAVPGDYNADGRTDIAFHRPGSTWNTVPVLLSNGDGSFAAKNYTAPGWANQPGVVAIPGDYNHDGRSDIAFHRPGGTWNTVPVLLSNGNGSFAAKNYTAPGWANQPGVVAIPGDYNHDGRSDIAFHRPGSTWNTVPVLLSYGNGAFAASNVSAPSWANQPGVVAVPADYNGDHRTDIAFHRPGSTWCSVPVLLSNGNGSFAAKNYTAPLTANQPGVAAMAGDYNNDGRSDIAFHRPGSSWTAVPVLLSNGNGSFAAKSYGVPSWANQAGVVAVTDRRRSDLQAAAPAQPVISNAQGSYGVDTSLSSPWFTSVTTMDNSVFLTWDDTNTQQTEYLIMVWENGTHLGPTEYRVPATERSMNFVGLRHGPLSSGASLTIHISAVGPRGISAITPAAQANASLRVPQIQIGDPATGAVSMFSAGRSFGAFDANGNGLLDSASGSASEIFPLSPSSSGAQPMAVAGKKLDSAGGLRANVVVGHYFYNGNLPEFVAVHLHVHPTTGTVHVISVLYGSAQSNVPGTVVWVGTAAVQYQLNNGTISGTVNGVLLASNVSNRVVEFDFNVVLVAD